MLQPKPMRSGPVDLRLPATHAGKIDRGDDAAQAFGIIAAVEVFAGDVLERHRRRRHQVAQAHFVRFQSGLARDGVKRHFQREAHARPRDAAIRQDRRLVGRRGEGAAAIRLHHIRPRQDRRHLRRFQTRRERIGRIRAGIDHRLGIDADQRAVRFGVQRDIVVVLSTVGVAGKLLAAILDPAHRMAETTRQICRADFLRQQDALVAEAAADIGRHDANPRLLEPEASRQSGAHDVRHLGGGVDQQLLQPPIPGGDDAAAFQRRHALPRRSQAPPHHDRRRSREPLRRDLDERLQEHIVVPVFVQPDRAGERGAHVHQRRQLVELDIDCGRQVFRFGAVRCDTDRDRLADVTHLVGRQHGLRGRLEPRQT